MRREREEWDRAQLRKTRMEIAADMFELSGIPPRCKEPAPPGNKHYDHHLQRLTQLLGTPFVALVNGSRGVGKTQMACDLIRAHYEKFVPRCINGELDCAYLHCTLMNSFMLFTRLRDNKESAERFLEELRAPQLLVLDDCHRRNHTTFEDNCLEEVIAQRYDQDKSTLLLGNYKPELFNDAATVPLPLGVLQRMQDNGKITIARNWKVYR